MTWEEAGLITDDADLKSLLYSAASRNIHVGGLQEIKREFEYNKREGIKQPTLDQWLTMTSSELKAYQLINSPKKESNDSN